MIWGLPGMCDGYGFELADFIHLDEYLAYINLTYADYTDIPEERPKSSIFIRYGWKPWYT